MSLPRLALLAFCASALLAPALYAGPVRPKPARLHKKRQTLPTALLRSCRKLGCRGRIYRMRRRRIDRLLAHLHKSMTYHQRLAVLSRMFKGARYKLDPLGEGKRGKVDRDPIFRLDLVDCVTFVETVMGLARARSYAEAKQATQAIRYKDGVRSYRCRNHFTASQWIPATMARGELKLVTRAVGGKLVVTKLKRLPKSIWTKTKWSKRLGAARLPKNFSYTFIPLSKLAAVRHKLPTLGFFAEIWERAKVPNVVRHTGFIVWKRGVPYLRHATRDRGTTDMSVTRYIASRARRAKYQRKRGKRIRATGLLIATFVKPGASRGRSKRSDCVAAPAVKHAAR